MRSFWSLCGTAMVVSLLALTALPSAHAACLSTWGPRIAAITLKISANSGSSPPACMIGCDGSFCATNYGECCGIHYKYSFATGYCQPGEDLRGTEVHKTNF